MNSNMKTKSINLLKALILPMAIFLIMLVLSGGRLFKSASIILTFRQSVVPIMIAMAIGFNMMMRMWDFSAGSVVYASAMIGSTLSRATGTGVAGLFVFCVVVAVGMTLLTGSLYRFLKIPAMVLTIGLTIAYEGIPRLLSIKQARIGAKDTILAAAPWCFIILLIMGLIFYVIFNFTPFGHNVMAIGDNQKNARIAGIKIEKAKFTSFVLSGLFLGVASALFMSQKTTLFPAFGFSSAAMIFDAMMGVFIAFFLMRYCNFTFGIAIGTLTMQILMFGLISMGISNTTRAIIQGIFLMIVLAFSSNQGKIDEYRNSRRLRIEADQKYEMSLKK